MCQIVILLTRYKYIKFRVYRVAIAATKIGMTIDVYDL
jgi:hypothetical protein